MTPLEQQALDAARNGNKLVTKVDKTGIMHVTEEPMFGPDVQPEPIDQPATPDVDFADMLSDTPPAAPTPEHLEDLTDGQTIHDEGQPAVQEPAPAAKYCPHCGWDQSRTDVEATVSDRLEFVRSILGDRPFSKAYPLYAGEVELLFKAMSVAQEEKLTSVMYEAIQSNALVNDVSVVRHKRELYRLVCTLDEVMINGERSRDLAVPIELMTLERLEEQWKMYTETLAPSVVSGAWEASQKFVALCNLLCSRASDESFWKGLS